MGVRRFTIIILVLILTKALCSEIIATTSQETDHAPGDKTSFDALNEVQVEEDLAKRLKTLYTVLADKTTKSSVKVRFVQSEENLGFLLDVLTSSVNNIDAKRLALQNIEALAEVEENKVELVSRGGVRLLHSLREALLQIKLRTTTLMTLVHLSALRENIAFMASEEIGLLTALCSLLRELYIPGHDDRVSVATRLLILRLLKTIFSANNKDGSTSSSETATAVYININLEVLAVLNEALQLGNADERKIVVALLVHVSEDSNTQLLLASRELGLLPILVQVARRDYNDRSNQYALMVLGQILLQQPKAREQWSDAELNLTALLKETVDQTRDDDTKRFALKFLRLWSGSSQTNKKTDANGFNRYFIKATVDGYARKWSRVLVSCLSDWFTSIIVALLAFITFIVYSLMQTTKVTGRSVSKSKRQKRPTKHN